MICRKCALSLVNCLWFMREAWTSWLVGVVCIGSRFTCCRFIGRSGWEAFCFVSHWKAWCIAFFWVALGSFWVFFRKSNNICTWKTTFKLSYRRSPCSPHTLMNHPKCPCTLNLSTCLSIVCKMTASLRKNILSLISHLFSLIFYPFLFPCWYPSVIPQKLTFCQWWSFNCYFL